MGILGKLPKVGGLMDVIRCDETNYLIWKWHPTGSISGFNNKENAIRFGSSIRVKEGEVAVFFYTQNDGTIQDFIEGPYDGILETKNLPVISNIIGLAYEGDTPFQAEVYFINLAEIIQVQFGVPYFDIFDPRFLDFGVPTAVRGRITFNIKDYAEFIKLHRLANFDLQTFQSQIKDAVVRYVKSVVANVPQDQNIPVVQIERKISLINDLVEKDIRERLEKDFAVNITAVDINAIEIDKSSEGYKHLKAITQDIATANIQNQSEVNIKNMHDMQRINAENIEESLKIQREETQYAQHKQTQTANFDAYQLEQQAAVGIAGAKALGQMGLNGATEISSGGEMNPAAMMTGMAMGGTIGANMAGMMNNMMNSLNSPTQAVGTVPPPLPTAKYHVAINNQSSGPFDIDTISQMIASGMLTKDSLVWMPGMPDWVKAESLQDFVGLFNQTPPPLPKTPLQKT